MYRVERRSYGAEFAFAGRVTADEMQQWSREAAYLLRQLPAGFGVLVDNRQLPPGGICPEAHPILTRMQRRYRKCGMGRSCVVLRTSTEPPPADREQNAMERFINTTTMQKWEQAAMAWLQDGVEPEQGLATV